MITFEQIAKANEGLSSIDIKGKDYIQVPERVKAFRMLFPEGFIRTSIVSLEKGICVMQSKVGYYENGHEIVLGTGMAYEKEENGFINKTSYIENCETSAVGRALGFLALGIDGGGICSAEELMNAIRNQENPVRALPVKNSASELINNQGSSTSDVSLEEIRTKVEKAVKNVTKDMSREQKIAFLNNVVTPTLQGERNWKLCTDKNLLSDLLTAIEQKAA